MARVALPVGARVEIDKELFRRILGKSPLPWGRE